MPFGPGYWIPPSAPGGNVFVPASKKFERGSKLFATKECLVAQGSVNVHTLDRGKRRCSGEVPVTQFQEDSHISSFGQYENCPEFQGKVAHTER
jgi:hypothetical protein